jgi:hypothetical protein
MNSSSDCNYLSPESLGARVTGARRLKHRRALNDPEVVRSLSILKENWQTLKTLQRASQSIRRGALYGMGHRGCEGCTPLSCSRCIEVTSCTGQRGVTFSKDNARPETKYKNGVHSGIQSWIHD